MGESKVVISKGGADISPEHVALSTVGDDRTLQFQRGRGPGTFESFCIELGDCQPTKWSEGRVIAYLDCSLVHARAKLHISPLLQLKNGISCAHDSVDVDTDGVKGCAGRVERLFSQKTRKVDG